MNKLILYIVAGSLLLALISSLVTGFVTRAVVERNDTDQQESQKNCNERNAFSNILKAPSDFIWSSGSASYQLEGDYEGVYSGGKRIGRGWSNWDYFTHIVKLEEGHTGDEGSKLFDNLDDDIALLKKLGISHYRFSLSWPRLIPSGYAVSEGNENAILVDKWFYETLPFIGTPIPQIVKCKAANTDPTGELYCKPWPVSAGWNDKGGDLYESMAKKLQDAGMQPVISLYHWDHPLQFNSFGAWTNVKMVDRFLEYAEYTFRKLGHLSDYWIVIDEPSLGPSMYELETIRGGNSGAFNDPNLMTHNGWKASGPDYLRVRHHIVLAHHRVYKLVEKLKTEKVLSASFQIGTNLAVVPILSESSDKKTIEAVEFASNVWKDFDYWPSVTGRYLLGQSELWTSIFGSGDVYGAIVLPEHVLEIEESPSPDFLGLTMYPSVYVRSVSAGVSWKKFEVYTPGQGKADEGSEINTGTCIKDWLVSLYHHTHVQTARSPPIIIWGSGFSGPEGETKDVSRCEFIGGTTKGVMDSILEGVDIRGMGAWSSHDGFEWTSGYTNTHGIIAVDRNTFKRTPKMSYSTLQTLTKQQATFDGALCK